MAQLGKVTVVGVGQVGMACAVSLLTKVCGVCVCMRGRTCRSSARESHSAYNNNKQQHTVSNLVLFDANRDKLVGSFLVGPRGETSAAPTAPLTTSLAVTQLGEVLDLQHAGAFLPGSITAASADMVRPAAATITIVVTPSTAPTAATLCGALILSGWMCRRRRPARGWWW